MTISEPSSWSPDHLSKDRALSLMSRPRRRAVVHALLEADGGSLTRTELVNVVAAGEEERPPERIEAEVLRTVQTSLDHIHLPKLADVGVVDYDRKSGSIALGPAADDVVPLLRFVAESE
jgi:hypothetical protein